MLKTLRRLHVLRGNHMGDFGAFSLIHLMIEFKHVQGWLSYFYYYKFLSEKLSKKLTWIA